MRKLTQIQLLREFSENAIKKIIGKFSNDASEEEIRRELKDFEKYKNGIQLKDPFQYKTWLDFTQAIHGAKGKSEFKNRNLKDKSKPKTFVNKSEESSEAIVDDENVTIFKGDEEHKCVKYGAGYSFCISRPGGGNMFGNYRLQKASTFYFIYFKNVPKSDPKHIMVLDKTEYGWEWTFADNNTQEIEGEFNEVVQNFPVLGEYESIFENNPLTDKEKYELKEVREFGKFQSLEKFNSYDYSLKDKIVKSGVLLMDDIFKTLDKNLRNEYVSVGGNLTKYQADNLNDSEIARYRKVRVTTLPEFLNSNNYGEDTYTPSKLDADLLDGLDIRLNSKGNIEMAYVSDHDGSTNHVEYDEYGNTIYGFNYAKDGSKVNEWWQEYDKNGSIVYDKDDYWENWYKYDENDKLIYKKELGLSGFGVGSLMERWYNEKGISILIHQKTDEKEAWYGENGVEIPNPNIKTESLNINIKKYTQADLISEGFWDSFKTVAKNTGKAAKWGVRAAAKTLDYVAPELTQPLHKLEAGVRDILGLKPADARTWNQNLNATGGTVNFQGKQYLIDIAKGVTPVRNGHYVVKANMVNSAGKKSHKIVSLEMDKDFNVYGLK